MITIPLTQGYVSLIDDEDQELVSAFSWHIFPNFDRGHYAVSSQRVDGKPTTIRMHRLIMGVRPDQIIDHLNRNGLDNRRENLRVANRSFNAANSKHRRDRSSSPYRGVYRNKLRFQAQIRVNGKLIRLGSFIDPQEAALRYDVAARTYFGDFAQCNFSSSV